VFAAIVMAAIAAVAVGGIAVGSAVVARHRAQSAADLAALAAAARVPVGAQAACRQAHAIAAAMRVTVEDCQLVNLDVQVTVSAQTGLRIGGQAVAVARAGPTARE
jgi:secretion/DNA translocation related TadE-like protein